MTRGQPTAPANEQPLPPEFAEALARAERYLQIRRLIAEEFITEQARELGERIGRRAEPFLLREERSALDEGVATETRVVADFDIQGVPFTLFRQGLTFRELQDHAEVLINYEPFQPRINWALQGHLLRQRPLIVPQQEPGELFTVLRRDQQPPSNLEIAQIVGGYVNLSEEEEEATENAAEDHTVPTN